MTDHRPLDCEEAVRLLALFLDGELRSGEADGVARHLEQCRSCFSRAEFEKRLKAQLAALGHPPVDPAFEERVRRLVRQFTCR